MLDQLIFLTQNAQEGRLFGLDQQTLIQIGIQLLNAVILFAVLTYLLYKPVKAYLAKRQEKIRQNFSDAEEEMAKAKELISQYEEKIAKINEERSQILAQAEVNAANEKKRIIAEAHEEADKIKALQAQKAADQSIRMREEMRALVIDYSALMAEKLILEEMDETARAKYTSWVTASLEDKAWPN